MAGREGLYSLDMMMLKLKTGVLADISLFTRLLKLSLS